MEVVIQAILLLIFLLLSSLFFIIFATLANDFKLVIPVSALAALISLIFTPLPASLILGGGFFLSFLLSSFFLQKKLAVYFTFQPTSLLLPSIKQTIFSLLIVSSVAFYFSINTEIKQNGFKIPSSLIDTSLKFLPEQQLPQLDNSASQINISPDQLKLLKQNPELIKQYGLDPNILDQVTSTQTLTSQDLIKPMVEAQLENFIKPYINLIPIISTLIFFFTLQSLASLFSIFLNPILWFIFWTLEKSEFVRFETEQREVKKLVV